MRVSVFFIISMMISSSSWAQEKLSCEQVPGYESVRFIAGTWSVYSSGDDERRYRVGVHQIEPTETGCAFSEHWRSIAGVEGEGMFYYSAADSVWKQIIMNQTEGMRSGEMYEKSLLQKDADGRIQFEGEAISPSGTSYLERSTYKPLPDYTVHFVMESSRDEGATWETNIDAVFVKGESSEM